MVGALHGQRICFEVGTPVTTGTGSAEPDGGSYGVFDKFLARLPAQLGASVREALHASFPLSRQLSLPQACRLLSLCAFQRSTVQRRAMSHPARLRSCAEAAGATLVEDLKDADILVCRHRQQSCYARAQANGVTLRSPCWAAVAARDGTNPPVNAHWVRPCSRPLRYRANAPIGLFAGRIRHAPLCLQPQAVGGPLANTSPGIGKDHAGPAHRALRESSEDITSMLPLYEGTIHHACLQSFAPLPQSRLAGFERLQVTLSGLRGADKPRLYYLADCMGARGVPHLITHDDGATNTAVQVVVCSKDERWQAVSEALRAWSGADASVQRQIAAGLAQEAEKLPVAVRCASLQTFRRNRCAVDADQACARHCCSAFQTVWCGPVRIFLHASAALGLGRSLC